MGLESLDGVLSRVLWHDYSKWSSRKYLIGRTHAGVTVKGECHRPVVGERYRFWGEFKEQRGRDEPAFVFQWAEPVVDRSASGVEQYLATHVDGVGRARAAALVEHFGVETLDVLRSEPERATEAPGITGEVASSIRRHFEEDCPLDPAAYAKLTDLFASGGHRVPRRVVRSLVKAFGGDAPAVVCEDPYRHLLPYSGIGWKTADGFAMTTARYDPAGLSRQVAALAEALERIADEGHTHAGRPEIAAQAYKLLGAEPTAEAWDRAFAEGVIVGDGETYGLPRYWAAEGEIAGQLAILLGAARPLGFRLDRDGLKGDQLRGVDVIEAHGVCLITGPPGCGKSFLVSRVIRSLRDHGVKSIRVVAPTGKAAKRAAELLAEVGIGPGEVACSTIHKALGPQGPRDPDGVPSAEAKVGRGRDEVGFFHNEENPLEVDVLFADETSMDDVLIMSALLRAIAPGTRVVFVGDQDQLPSVRPGSVLRDMIAAGLPRAELDEIKRSDGGGRVVRACHAIRAGRTPEPAAALSPPTENWVHVEEHDPHAIADVIVELHRMARSFDPVWDYQVVSAQKKRHPFACEGLNRRLSDLLNPAPAADDDDFRPPFRVGDKVIRKKNGVVEGLVEGAGGAATCRWGGRSYRIRPTAVVNGDMGTVLGLDRDGRDAWAIVRLRDPDRLCRLPMDEHHLQPAYAITVHSAQGSGFPVVILPVHTLFYPGLWVRELFYTGLSRAEQVLVTVGPWAAIGAAVGRRTVHRRRTRLAGLAREALAGVAAEAMEVAR